MSKDDESKSRSDGRVNWAGAASLAGAAIGSAALTAALIYANRKRPKPTDAPARPEDAPETD